MSVGKGGCETEAKAENCWEIGGLAGSCSFQRKALNRQGAGEGPVQGRAFPWLGQARGVNGSTSPPRRPESPGTGFTFWMLAVGSGHALGAGVKQQSSAAFSSAHPITRHLKSVSQVSAWIPNLRDVL